MEKEQISLIKEINSKIENFDERFGVFFETSLNRFGGYIIKVKDDIKGLVEIYNKVLKRLSDLENIIIKLKEEKIRSIWIYIDTTYPKDLGYEFFMMNGDVIVYRDMSKIPVLPKLELEELINVPKASEKSKASDGQKSKTIGGLSFRFNSLDCVTFFFDKIDKLFKIDFCCRRESVCGMIVVFVSNLEIFSKKVWKDLVEIGYINRTPLVLLVYSGYKDLKEVNEKSIKEMVNGCDSTYQLIFDMYKEMLEVPVKVLQDKKYEDSLPCLKTKEDLLELLKDDSHWYTKCYNDWKKKTCSEIVNFLEIDEKPGFFRDVTSSSLILLGSGLSTLREANRKKGKESHHSAFSNLSFVGKGMKFFERGKAVDGMEEYKFKVVDLKWLFECNYEILFQEDGPYLRKQSEIEEKILEKKRKTGINMPEEVDLFGFYLTTVEKDGKKELKMVHTSAYHCFMQDCDEMKEREEESRKNMKKEKAKKKGEFIEEVT